MGHPSDLSAEYRAGLGASTLGPVLDSLLQVLGEFLDGKIDEILVVSNFPQFPFERISEFRSAEDSQPSFLKFVGENSLEDLLDSLTRNRLFRSIGDDRGTACGNTLRQALGESVHAAERKQSRFHCRQRNVPGLGSAARAVGRRVGLG